MKHLQSRPFLTPSSALLLLLSGALLATLVISLVSIFIGCAVEDTESPTIVIHEANVDRFVDKEAGVVCWTYRYHHGISCLPLDNTLLTIEESQ